MNNCNKIVNDLKIFNNHSYKSINYNLNINAESNRYIELYNSNFKNYDRYHILVSEGNRFNIKSKYIIEKIESVSLFPSHIKNPYINIDSEPIGTSGREKLNGKPYINKSKVNNNYIEKEVIKRLDEIYFHKYDSFTKIEAPNVKPKTIYLENKINDCDDYEIYKDFYEEVGYHNPYISEIKRVISRDGSVFGISL